MLLALANELLGDDIRSKIAASDIVQQSLWEAYQQRHAIDRSDRGRVARWTAAILLNNIKDAGKAFRHSLKRCVQRERRLGKECAMVAWSQPGPDPLIQDEQLQLMLVSFNQLPAAHQQVLRWRFFEEKSFSEIGALVNRSEDAVRMMVSRSLKRLAKELRCHDLSTAC